MAVFSTRQVRQLYVVNDCKDNLSALENAGDICVNTTIEDEMFFDYIGALGDTMASDMIKFKGIESASATSSDDIAHKIYGYKVTLNEKLNGGLPVAGQDYILKATVYEYKGMSGENEGNKYGMVHAYPDMTASELYKVIACNFAQNNRYEPSPFLKVCVCVNDEYVEVLPGMKPSDIEGDAAAIFVCEKEQKWIRGLMEQQSVNFDMSARPILVDGDFYHWEVIEKVITEDTLPEGQIICDLEWFAMGERGDQYRGMGYPNIVPTRYMAFPDKLYDVITIHYHYRDHGMSPQFSEKAIQLACLNDGSHTVANALIGKINEAADLSISTL